MAGTRAHVREAEPLLEQTFAVARGRGAAGLARLFPLAESACQLPCSQALACAARFLLKQQFRRGNRALEQARKSAHCLACVLSATLVPRPGKRRVCVRMRGAGSFSGERAFSSSATRVARSKGVRVPRAFGSGCG